MVCFLKTCLFCFKAGKLWREYFIKQLWAAVKVSQASSPNTTYPETVGWKQRTQWRQQYHPRLTCWSQLWSRERWLFCFEFYIFIFLAGNKSCFPVFLSKQQERASVHEAQMWTHAAEMLILFYFFGGRGVNTTLLTQAAEGILHYFIFIWFVHPPVMDMRPCQGVHLTPGSRHQFPPEDSEVVPGQPRDVPT